MSPAKATRPGYRSSMASPGELGEPDQAAIGLFHPIYHGFTYPIGNRIDIERLWPVHLDQEDEEDLIDIFSEPPVWLERFSPLGVQLGEHVLRAKSASELMLNIYRMTFEMLQGIGNFVETSITQNTGQALRVPFMSLCVDPDTIHRLIESDYESGETGYATLMKLFAEGTAAPCLTTPFHTLLPFVESKTEARLCLRAGFVFYTDIVRLYRKFLKEHGESGLMVLPFWLPEGAFSHDIVQLILEEFKGFCKREKIAEGHLLLLLDNHQARFDENDVLMKSWNQLPPSASSGNGKGRRPRARRGRTTSPHVESISVVFRDRAFSDWVIHASPSVKKLLDRTIAKVDSDINTQSVHYGWAHFEELEAITYDPKAIVNFQQKLIKLVELGYLPLSPDFYVRGKLRGEFGCIEHEPQHVEVPDRSAGNGWDLERSQDFGRWFGIHEHLESPKERLVARPYERPTEEGSVTEPGHTCWKVAWEEARGKVARAVMGDLTSLKGGMAEVLGRLSGQRGQAKARHNVEDFLAHYAYVYWREHFIQHDLAEADINIIELADHHLRAGLKTAVKTADAAKAGCAAQAIYFALDSKRSTGMAWENMDQRAFYQNVVALTLAVCNAMYVHHWLGDTKSAKRLLDLMKTELFDFKGAYERYKLSERGISRTKWRQATRSEIKGCPDNVVRRAALRTAARHLRPLGYTREFTRRDANITTDVGHIWSHETGREGFAYENTAFCGVEET